MNKYRRLYNFFLYIVVYKKMYELIRGQRRLNWTDREREGEREHRSVLRQFYISGSLIYYKILNDSFSINKKILEYHNRNPNENAYSSCDLLIHYRATTATSIRSNLLQLTLKCLRKPAKLNLNQNSRHGSVARNAPPPVKEIILNFC